jgi:hypothetical protein
VLLAEAISLDAGEVAALLIVFALFCIATVAVVVLGFVWAGRAGRGSQRATVGWAIVAALETMMFVLLVATAGVNTSPVILLVGPALVGGQLIVFLRARRRPTPPS